MFSDIYPGKHPKLFLVEREPVSLVLTKNSLKV